MHQLEVADRESPVSQGLDPEFCRRSTAVEDWWERHSEAKRGAFIEFRAEERSAGEPADVQT